MVELCGLCTKAGFNIAQALAPGQLRECEAQILIEARKPLDPALAVVARHATTKRCQRQVLHKLGKDIMALMHGDTLAAVGPHRCAAFPFTIEIETAPKSLFFPKFQHVSVGPTSNVGTAVEYDLKPKSIMEGKWLPVLKEQVNQVLALDYEAPPLLPRGIISKSDRFRSYLINA